ncbi:MAG: MaoC family dehydratase [Myxococcota bacterium]|jgi:3-hydroxybutyryl-CoA dehydratase|nr:MaoC family dehydratase [Myxococcota bacterium]
MTETTTTIVTLIPGDAASFSKTITEADVVLFAGVTGDMNPVHIDEVAARETIFKGRIVHGMLPASLISTVLGTLLPGPGTIYLSQSLNFRRPVRIGDTVKAVVTVKSVDGELPTCTLDTIVTNQEGKVVVEGEARVQLPGPG